MADNEIDNKTKEDQPSAKKAATNDKSKKDSVTAKKEPAVKKAENLSSKAGTKSAVEAAPKGKNSTIENTPAKKESIVDKKPTDDAVKAKQSKTKKSVEALKARAHEARLRAQKKILDKSYVSDPPADPLERLANTFDNSARRWEMVVYPSLFAFVLLAGYGFFLIYRLTHDISTLSQSVTRMAVIVSDAMPRMSKDMKAMTGSMDHMTGDIGGMTTEMVSMSNQMDSLTPMSNNIQSMTHNIGSMNRSVYGMQRDMHGMNRTVSSGPFGMMNDAMPFSSNTNVPPPIQPGPVWPAYGNVARQQPYSGPQVQPRNNPIPRKPVPQVNNKTEVILPGTRPLSAKTAPSTKPSTQGQ